MDNESMPGFLMTLMLLSHVLMLCVSRLASILPIGGVTSGEVSDAVTSAVRGRRV